MKLDYLKYALDNVKHRKLRSWLTILSIMIGIASIFALVSFGQGMSDYVNSLSSQMGTDKLIVQPKAGGAPGVEDQFYLKKDDIEFLRKMNGIEEMAGVYTKIIEIFEQKEKKYVMVIAIPQDSRKNLFMELLTVEMEKGRELKHGDTFKVVLGYNYMLPDKIFHKGIKLNDKMLINGHLFEVVGFFGSIGNPQDDSNVYMTEEDIESLFPETKDRYQMGFGRVEPGENPAGIAERAEEKLRRFKNEEEGKESFYIQTFEQAIETFMTVLTVINAILVLIALISLIVAGVNIMNTMYTAVMERTREIGVMKAIGAKNSDILIIFLFESGLLGMVGGFFGILFGYGIAKLGGAIAAASGYSALYPIFPWQLTVGCLLFAFTVGTLAGLLPARQASKLKPVDALRYE